MVISKTPLRFSLLGGGSDLPAYFSHYPGGGAVISMALDTYIYVTFYDRRAYSGNADAGYLTPIRIAYTMTENVHTIDDIKHELVHATIERLLTLDGVDNNSFDSFELTTIGEIPSRGAGLGSSASLVVGILNVLDRFSDSLTLTCTAWDVEAGLSSNRESVGFQDQLVAVHGGLCQYRMPGECGMYDISEQPLSVGEELAKSIIAFRLPAERTGDAKNFAGHARLTSMTDEMVYRAKYLRQTVELIDLAWECLSANGQIDLSGLGELMRKAWNFKLSSHYHADESDSKAISLVEAGLVAGAYAGKVSGSMSAGTGHLFFLAPCENQDVIRGIFSDYAELRVGYCHAGAEVIQI